MPRLSNRYLYCPKITGNFASTPDSSALDITGDIEIVTFIEPVRWVTGVVQTIVGKYNVGSNQRSYRLYIETTGLLSFAKSADGSGVAATSSTVRCTEDTAPIWVKVTWRASDGRVQFFTAPSAGDTTEPSSWTQLGTDRSATAGAMFNSNAALAIGSKTEGDNTFGGKIYRAIIRDGIGGTKVFDADFSTLAPGTTSFTETGSNATVTVNTSGGNVAAVVGRTQASTRTESSTPRVRTRSMASALRFTASSGYGLASSASGYSTLTNYSLAFWIKAQRHGASDQIIYGEGSSSTDTPFFAIRIGSASAAVSGKLLYYARDNSNTVNVNGTNYQVCDGLKHFVVFTDANGTLNMYVDGVLDRSLTYTKGTLTLNQTSIGVLYRTTTSVNAIGELDNIRVYDGILTAQQISDMYYHNILPTTGVTLFREWLLNEGSGTSAADSSGNGVNLTLTSPQWVTNEFLNDRTEVA